MEHQAPPRIALLGDVMLGRGVAHELRSRDAADVWAPEVREIALACDAVVLNLECCISDRGEPTGLIRGKSFFFRAPPNAVGSLRAVGASVAGLANNHALDYGPDALADTLELLGEAGIAAPGAGHNCEEARRGAVIEAAGTRIGIVAASDHPVEFAAGPGRAGIAHAELDRGVPKWLVDEQSRLRPDCDHLIAFVHWGPNMTTEPARWQRDAAAELLDAGADLVAGHSAHVFHGVAWNGGRPLLYDLGDALDDYAVDPSLRNDLGVMAIWTPGSEPGIELVGLRLEYCFTRLAIGDDAEWIAARLDHACSELGSAVERTGEQRFAVRAD